MTVAGADATSLTWDGSDIVTSGAQGGSGTWNMNSTLNWWDGALGTDVVWPNAGSDNDAIFANTAGTVTLATGGVSANDLTFSSSGYLIQSETLTLNGTAPTITTDPGVSATISSVVAGAAGLVKSGSGTLTLSGANTYGGNTSVNAGTLVLRQQTNGGTITTASGATTEWQQTADMEWSFGLQPGCGIFAGAGRVNKTGTSNMYGDHASGGTFKVNQSAGAVFDMQGGRFNQGGGGGGFLSTNLGSLNVASGAAIGLFASNAVVDALTGSGTIVNDYPGDRTLSVGAANHTASVDNPYFTGTSATFSGTLGNGTAGTLALIKSGSGKQTLTGTNSYSGGTTVNGGSLQLGDGSTNGVITGNIANTANVTFNNASAQTFAGAISGTAGTLGKSGAGTLTLTGNNSYTGATTINVGTLEVKPAAGYTTTSSGYAVAAGAAFTFSLASANDATLASPLSGAGTVNLVNTGYSMHLNANNSAFTGTLKTSGTSALFLGTAAATSASTAYVIDMSNGGVAYGSLCTQNIADGSTIHLGSLSGTTPTSKISSGHGAGVGTLTWSIGALGTDTTFAGYFANYGMVTALTKVGSGTLTLTGTNTYTGATNVSGGSLVLRQQHTGGTITTASGAITEWQQTAAMGYWHGLTGTITFAGAGRLNKTGAFDMYGDQGEGGNSIRVDQSAGGLFDMQAGRFDQGSGGGFKSTNRGSLNVAAGATIGLFTSNAMVDALTGSGTIVNGYGNSTVTLTVGAANHTSSVDNPYFTGTSATFSGALGNGTAGTLALAKTGSGTQILTGASTYSGGTIVSNGTLLVNNTSDSGTGSGAVTVTGGILGGTGSIAGAVTLNGGSLAPGASIGSLAVGGDLTFATATTFAYEMNHSAAAEATGDLLLVSGNSLSLAKATGEKVYLTLSDLAASSGAFAPNSTTLSLIQYAGNWNGGFFTYGTNELSDGEQFTDAYSNHWTIRYAAEVGGANFASAIAGSHFITLSNLTAIPEPGSLLALGCLVGSGMFLRSRRRN